MSVYHLKCEEFAGADTLKHNLIVVILKVWLAKVPFSHNLPFTFTLENMPQ